MSAISATSERQPFSMSFLKNIARLIKRRFSGGECQKRKWQRGRVSLISMAKLISTRLNLRLCPLISARLRPITTSVLSRITTPYKEIELWDK